MFFLNILDETTKVPGKTKITIVKKKTTEDETPPPINLLGQLDNQQNVLLTGLGTKLGGDGDKSNPQQGLLGKVTGDKSKPNLGLGALGL